MDFGSFRFVIRARNQPLVIGALFGPSGDAEWTSAFSSFALDATAGQIAVCNRAGCEPDAPGPFAFVVCSQRALTCSDLDIELCTRTSEEDSGWYLGVTLDQPREPFESLTVLGVILRKPCLAPYLGLGTGCLVVFQDTRLLRIVPPPRPQP